MVFCKDGLESEWSLMVFCKDGLESEWSLMVFCKDCLESEWSLMMVFHQGDLSSRIQCTVEPGLTIRNCFFEEEWL